jgi:hypothetical protein
MLLGFSHTVPANSYHVIARVDPNNTPGDANPGNNVYPCREGDFPRYFD